MGKRSDLVLGDLRIVDDGELGFTIYRVSKLEKLVCWVNLKGERELLRWLKEKPVQKNEEPPLGGVSKLSEMFEQEKQDVLDNADTGAVPGFPDGE